MSGPIVRMAGVSKRFHSASGASIVLEDVDVAIAPGQKVSLVGPSGSGKSTLLALMAGLLRPDSGNIYIDGKPLDGLDDTEMSVLRARRIGIALQSDNLIPFLSAFENIELAAGFGGHLDKAQRAHKMLERMGVAHRANHLPRQLSGGEAQRVSLGVALANRPALLLADEMVAQLDAATAGDIVSDVFSTDMAVLFVTHDPRLADRADLRLRIHQHRVVSR